jgi:hypothetical protein
MRACKCDAANCSKCLGAGCSQPNCLVHTNYNKYRFKKRLLSRAVNIELEEKLKESKNLTIDALNYLIKDKENKYFSLNRATYNRVEPKLFIEIYELKMLLKSKLMLNLNKNPQ